MHEMTCQYGRLARLVPSSWSPRGYAKVVHGIRVKDVLALREPLPPLQIELTRTYLRRYLRGDRLVLPRNEPIWATLWLFEAPESAIVQVRHLHRSFTDPTQAVLFRLQLD